jgi:hypothetical protein
MALRRGGVRVLANDDGFYFFDFESGRLDLSRTWSRIACARG